MNRFNNILFVAEGAQGEKAALNKVLELASLNNAKVTILSVLVDYSSKYILLEPTDSFNKLHLALAKEKKQELLNLLASSKYSGPKVKTAIVVKEGAPEIEIIKAVQKDNYDLVAKASHNENSLGDLIFGTLDMNLLRKCPCPVFIIKPRKKIKHSRILAALDLSGAGKKGKSLDVDIMDLASSLTKVEESSLNIIHAWEMPFANRLKNEERVGYYKKFEAIQNEMYQANNKNLKELVANYAEFDPKITVRKGKPEVVIPRFVKNNKIDLIVMGTVARTGIKGFFIGNTAEKILHGINCSVLAIKPAGFKTPI